MIMEALESLNTRFSIEDAVSFNVGEGGLPRAVLTAGGSFAHVYLHGAHVALFQPEGAESVLFVSGSSIFRDGKAIRGGIPVIFPWFGDHKSNSSLPAHGFARNRAWTVTGTECIGDGSVKIRLELRDDEATRALWPHPFNTKLIVTLGKRLELNLEVSNTGKIAFEFEEALHSYFRVGDIRKTSLTGLEDVEYIDKVDGRRLKKQGDCSIEIEGETDRIYLDTTSTCVISDSFLKRKIHIEKSGSASTVVWNPWVEKSASLSDFGDDEWQRMICVETCNVDRNAVTLAPGATHTMRVRFSLG
jgi:glucose-6-phosphate 1-epimerase